MPKGVYIRTEKSKNNKGKKWDKPNPRKNKTYEEYYGEEKAKRVKEKSHNSHLGQKGSKEKKLKIKLLSTDWWKKNKGTEKELERNKKIGIKMSGENNPSWQNGISYELYTKEFNEELKEQIRKRDNYRCQECFRHQDELFDKKGKHYKLNVHHIDYNKKNNNPDNLISLCKSCHSKTNFKRTDWTNYFKENTN